MARRVHMRAVVKLNARQAARMLGVSETKIYRWVDAGEIPFTMVHHRPLFHRMELLEWAMSAELPLSVDLYENGEPSPLADALERGGGGSIGAALEAIAEDIPARSGAEREIFRDVIAARGEEMLVMRAADGIAMPRASSPIICPETPGLVLLRWAAPGALALRGVPILVVFLVVAPTIRRHHELLSRLSLALHDPAFRAATQRAGAFGVVLAEARRWEQALAARPAAGGAP